MPIRDFFLIFLVCVSWAFNFIAAAKGMQHFSPYVFMVLRFVIVLLFLARFLRWPPRDVASIVGHSLFFVLVQRHPVSAIMPYLLMTPLLGVIFGVVVWGDRPGIRLLIGGALVLLGIFVVTLRARQRSLGRGAAG